MCFFSNFIKFLFKFNHIILHLQNLLLFGVTDTFDLHYSILEDFIRFLQLCYSGLQAIDGFIFLDELVLQVVILTDLLLASSLFVMQFLGEEIVFGAELGHDDPFALEYFLEVEFLGDGLGVLQF